MTSRQTGTSGKRCSAARFGSFRSRDRHFFDESTGQLSGTCEKSWPFGRRNSRSGAAGSTCGPISEDGDTFGTRNASAPDG